MDHWLTLIEKHWHDKRVGLMGAPIFFWVLIVTALGAVAPEVYFLRICGFASIAGAIVPVVWLVCHRIPKHKKNQMGFDLLLYHESEEQGKRIRADFCFHLRNLLSNASLGSAFSFIEHPQWVCQKYSDDEKVKDLCFLTGCAFILHGKAKIRLIDGKEQHVLELSGGVRHAPIKQELRKKLISEMRLALGAQALVIAQENDIFTFKITASKIEIATKYIVSIASLVSGNLDYAEELLMELTTRLAAADVSNDSELAKIKTRLPYRIAEVGAERCRLLADKYIYGEDLSALELLNACLEKYKEHHKSWYSSYLLRSICKFELSRDIESARNILLQCAIFPDSTWRYSLAFLYAYEGDMSKSWEYYQKAFNVPLAESSIANQCESFIHRVLSKEPDKVQLWYCLGLINYKAKGDLAGAKRDFAAFLSNVQEGAFDDQRRLAANYISRIDKSLQDAVAV